MKGQLSNFITVFIIKNTRFLPSIFLSIILYMLISQIYFINDLPKLALELENKNIDYIAKNKKAVLEKKVLNKRVQTIINNKQGIESSARSQLKFIKKGEKYYNFP